jgi:septum formation protein
VFRPLTVQEIERYLLLETPYDCAGSFKAEALGITLLNALTSPDPTAIVGLPLIAVRRHLAQLGWSLPGALPV